jgi:glycosyltransferase involved in cell wall biosynthesis
MFLGVERFLARRTHALVALTDTQAEEMSATLRIAPRDRFVVIPLGLALTRFRLPAPVRDLFREKVRAELEIPDRAPVVGIVGRLVPVKNHDLMLRAFRALTERRGAASAGAAAAAGGSSARARAGAAEVPPVLLVVGGGERAAELRRLADSLGIADRVRWTGWRTDLPELYSAMDVVALTSLDEGTPVAVIEALAAGVPVVARSVGGVPRVLEGGEWGTLVESDDPSDFAEALRGALRRRPSPETREAAAARAVECYGEERLAREVSSLYRDLLRQAGRRA